MGLAYDEFELTESAYRHGYGDEDFADMLRGRHLIVQSRRGRLVGYEIFGRNAAGEYLLAAARVIQIGWSAHPARVPSEPDVTQRTEAIPTMARKVNKASTKRMTKAEAEYVADLMRDPPLARVERGASKILEPRDYPEPIKRFLARERLIVHVKLPAGKRRKLDALSRARGMTPAELAHHWLERSLEREAG